MSDFPAWRYHRGQFGRVESKIFQREADVPKGWVDSPAKLPPEPKAGRKPKSKTVSEIGDA